MLDIPERAQRVRLTGQIAKALMQQQRSLTVLAGRVVIPQTRRMQTHHVQAISLTRRLAGVAIEFKRALRVTQGPLIIAIPIPRPRKRAMRVRLLHSLTITFGRTERLVQLLNCLPVTTQIGVGTPDQSQGSNARNGITLTPSNLQCGAPRRKLIASSSLPDVEDAHRPSQPVNHNMPTMRRRSTLRCQQVRVFDLEPLHRRRYISKLTNMNHIRKRVNFEIRPVRLQHPIGGTRRMRVEMAHPPQRLLPTIRALLSMGAFGRIRSQQIVEFVPLKRMLPQHIDVEQILKR